MTRLAAAPREAAPGRLELPAFPDGRGVLTVAEAGDTVPFAIRRVYWIDHVPRGARRGGHAHRRAHELIVAAAGRFVVHCRGPAGTARFRLGPGSGGVLVPPMVWRELDGFGPGAVCLVLASEPYDPGEYVYDPQEFRALTAAD